MGFGWFPIWIVLVGILFALDKINDTLQVIAGKI